MSATRERSRQAFKMLEWRLMERALPDGIKKRRRTAIASLPRERREFECEHEGSVFALSCWKLNCVTHSVAGLGGKSYRTQCTLSCCRPW